MPHTPTPYPIGTPGLAWGEAERAQWLARQVRKRSYTSEVVARIDRLSAKFDVTEYGQLDYAPERYPLFRFAIGTGGMTNLSC